MRGRGSIEAHDRVRELLAAYAAGSTTAPERRRVGAHLGSCSPCRQELAGWRAVRGAVRAAAPAVGAPGPQLLAATLADVGAHPAARAPAGGGGLRRGLGHAGALLVGQAPLVRRRLWLASAVVMAVGAAIAAVGTRDAAGLVLALVAPVVAAAGLAVVYGPDVDPVLELAAATPTSPRSVLLARLTLVFGYDVLLALAASAALVAFGAAGSLWALVVAWFGPMALLSALSLAVSVWLGPGVALAAALVVWAARLLASRATLLLPTAAQRLADQLWSTNGVTVGVAVALVLAALALGPRRLLPRAATG